MNRIPNLPAYLEQALNTVCFGDPADLETALDTYFASDYQQVTDGETSDRAAFATHLAKLREVTAGGEITVQEAVQDGHKIARRHTVLITKADGGRVALEVYLFGELAEDGKLRRVHEITRPLSTSDTADQELARIR